jgi:hypothetical protein
MVHMHDPIACLEVRITGFWGFGYRTVALARFGPPPAKYFAVSQQVDRPALGWFERPTFSQAALQE